MKPASDDDIKRFMLIALDDYKAHEWDDLMIAVDEAFRKVGESTMLRQIEDCINELIDAGEVDEVYEHEWMSYQRVKKDPKPIEKPCQPALFEEPHQ